MSYRDLYVWRASVELAVRVSAAADSLIAQKRFSIADQMLRAALSIPSNISEGCGRLTEKEFRHFLGIARGSAYELQTQVEVARQSHTLNEAACDDFDDRLAKITYGLTKLIRKLQ